MKQVYVLHFDAVITMQYTQYTLICSRADFFRSGRHTFVACLVSRLRGLRESDRSGDDNPRQWTLGV